MNNLATRKAVSNAWRLRVESFAQRVSDGRWEPYPWLVYVLRRLQDSIMSGGARIIVNAPPRHGKSEGISHWLPTWFLDWFPDQRVILSGYGDAFAAKWGMLVRDEFAVNDRTWTRIRPDKSLASDWATTAGGGMLTVGVGGSMTGHGGNLLIIDDPHKNWEEAMSPTMRQKVIDWFNSTFYTRAEPDASIVVVQTRWHERDLSGYLMNEHEDDWEMLRLPALAEEGDPLGRTLDDPLCPKRYSKKALAEIKKAVGSHIFGGLYQQRPAPLAGNMVKRDWFRRWATLPDGITDWIQVWDLTFKKTGSSFVVGQVWGRKGAQFFLADQFRERLNFPETLKKIEAMSNRWPQAKEKIIEEAANGPAVIDSLSDSIPGIIGVKASSSKEARLAAVSGFIEAGNVWIPDQSVASWADDFVDEVVNFPNAANDDQVDAMTMALDRLGASSHRTDFVIPASGVRANPWEFS